MKINPTDVFRSENLKSWNPGVFAEARISETSKKYLEQIGLPLIYNHTVKFDVPRGALVRHVDRKKLLKIGNDYALSIFIDEENAGRVVGVDPEGMEVYFNDSVEKLGACLALYNWCGIMSPILSEILDVPVITEKIECEMKCIDPTAFENVNNWWPLVIEQLRFG